MAEGFYDQSTYPAETETTIWILCGALNYLGDEDSVAGLALGLARRVAAEPGSGHFRIECPLGELGVRWIVRGASRELHVQARRWSGPYVRTDLRARRKMPDPLLDGPEKPAEFASGIESI